MTSTQDEQLREAIRATEYKYFGDYEMSESQRKAVDVLVSHAEASLALKADDRSSMERLGTILRDTNFKPTKKYLGAAFLGYDYARRYYASLPAPDTAAPCKHCGKGPRAYTHEPFDDSEHEYEPQAPATGGDEALGWAKATAWHRYGIAWKHLERISQTELLDEARAALNPTQENAA